MNVFQKIFGGNPVPQRTEQNPSGNPQHPAAQQPSQAAPTNNPNLIQPSIQSAQSTGTAPNGVVPNNVQEPKSPLEAHADLWKDSDDGKGPKQPENIFNIKPEDVMAAAAKNDFVRNAVNKDDLAKLAQGGEEAVALTLQLLNKTAQNVYGQTAITTTQIVEQALKKQREQFETQLPALVRQYSVGESLRETRPELAHPAVAPIVDLIKDQLHAKHPDASAKQIEKMASEYMMSVGAVFNPNAQTTPQNSDPRKREEFDWDKFIPNT